MSEPQLLNRIKAIERAKGAYAAIKMKQFAQCLILEGFTTVAKEAEASLERLLQFDPTAVEA